FTVGYSGAPRETTVGASVEINVIKPALFICLLLSLVALVQRVTPLRKVSWTAMLLVAVLVLGFASGNRVEELGCILGVGWVIQNQQRYRRFPKRGVMIAAFLVLAMLVLGEIRSVLPSHALDPALITDAFRRALQIFPKSDTLQMKPTTNGDIATTLCVA